MYCVPQHSSYGNEELNIEHGHFMWTDVELILNTLYYIQNILFSMNKIAKSIGLLVNQR
jgi:hypothetical protein